MASVRGLEEAFFTCPHCWERVSVLVDKSVSGTQRYVEDCEVCCNPLTLRIRVEDHQLVDLEADAAQ
jgi:transcription elongation factor Elf1